MSELEFEVALTLRKGPEGDREGNLFTMEESGEQHYNGVQMSCEPCGHKRRRQEGLCVTFMDVRCLEFKEQEGWVGHELEG